MRRSHAPAPITFCLHTIDYFCTHHPGPYPFSGNRKDYLVTCFGTTRGLRRYCIISGLGVFQAPSELRELENESSVLPSPLFSFSLPELTDTPGRASHMLLSSQMSGLIAKALCVFVFTRCQPSLIQLNYSPGGWGTPLYGLYRDVPLDRVWFLSSLS